MKDKIKEILINNTDAYGCIPKENLEMTANEFLYLFDNSELIKDIEE